MAKRWYYRVKPEYDGKRTIATKKNGISYWHECIGNELYTEKELQKWNVPLEYVEHTLVPAFTVYYSFGVRFSTIYSYGLSI